MTKAMVYGTMFGERLSYVENGIVMLGYKKKI